MANYLDNLEPDVVSFILTNLLIYNVCTTYNDFISFFLAWEKNQTRSTVRYVVEHMEWEKMYDYHQYAYETEIPRFNMFVENCAHIHVVQACFLNSSKKLFKQQNVQHHLSVLQEQSTRHLESYFSCLVFKAIYRPFQNAVTVKQIFKLLRHTDFKYKIRQLMMLLASLKEEDEGICLMPMFKLCPRARHPEPFKDKPNAIWTEDVWNSLCDKVVQEDFKDGDYWKKDLSINMILTSNCSYCATQIIIYKLLLNDIM